ncbi:uncharacterized protein LOC110730344 isoform X2 [Chenopodium quinoa]|uniref:uncharacterized protein LOC110730344 isoform X2 n=1 Tax=Chenopodium quinoa TaxID=63459 RepID=UPI000B78756C|nr:uncharacterized protein LOC110730344 isoform X2 [Chenopodium quinoa]XP_021765842.1 uncharacterized protein LOC110730344 isoform X2 [Chenopodium quinoa]
MGNSFGCSASGKRLLSATRDGGSWCGLESNEEERDRVTACGGEVGRLNTSGGTEFFRITHHRFDARSKWSSFERYGEEERRKVYCKQKDEELGHYWRGSVTGLMLDLTWTLEIECISAACQVL